jgi:tRNA 2-selenouridine synthase SelU
MIIEQIPNDKRTKLQTALYSLTNSFARRGVSFVISAESEFVATFILQVSGRKGMVQKTFVLVFDQVNEEWNIFQEGYVYRMTILSEMSTLIKSKIQALHTIVSKL